jgi:hypothetical protein
MEEKKQVCKCGHSIDSHVPDNVCSQCECEFYEPFYIPENNLDFGLKNLNFTLQEITEMLRSINDTLKNLELTFRRR